MRHSIKLTLAVVLVSAGMAYAQATPPSQAIDPAFLNDPFLLDRLPPTPSQRLLYQDLDLLRRDHFAHSAKSTVALRVTNRDGSTPAQLQLSDLTLKVNGTERQGSLHLPSTSQPAVSPVVLLVFPPNQPMIHHLALKQATQYFSKQPETLPWKVGIFDSNSKLTAFTNNRLLLLSNLDDVGHAKEPLQYWSDTALPTGYPWNGSWLGRAEEAIALMENSEGPKVILAMNPLGEPDYGLNGPILSQDGPESLVQAAIHVGAHIYIANVGGPEVLIPGGDASQSSGSGGGSPSSYSRIVTNQMGKLNYFAMRNSRMMQTAEDTLGGFANTLDDLAQQIHRNTDGNYSLDFDLTPEDRDHGIPSVEVALRQHDLKVAILDVIPILSAPEVDLDVAAKKLSATLQLAAKHPVLSPDFRITQHVDYFPLRSGVEPLLPMSCVVEWTGQGHGPAQLSVVESVEDADLYTTILEQQIRARWDGRSLSWERDGRLRPGHYIWRVAVQDGSGKILSVVQEKVNIAFPGHTSLAFSSLILGKSCRDDDAPKSGLQQRPKRDTSGKQEVNLQIDPMRAVDCRLQPDVTGRFVSTDVVHAFMRIYPFDKLSKYGPERWTAKFVLRSASGAVETEKEIPLVMDSGSGFLASLELPLNTAEISSGQHTLDVQMLGPGIRGDFKKSRSLYISAK